MWIPKVDPGIEVQISGRWIYLTISKNKTRRISFPLDLVIGKNLSSMIVLQLLCNFTMCRIPISGGGGGDPRRGSRGERWGAHPPLGWSFTIQNALFNSIQEQLIIGRRNPVSSS